MTDHRHDGDFIIQPTDRLMLCPTEVLDHSH